MHYNMNGYVTVFNFYLLKFVINPGNVSMVCT